MNKNIVTLVVVLFIISILVGTLFPSAEYPSKRKSEKDSVETYLKDTLGYKAKVGVDYNKSVSKLKDSDALLITYKKGFTTKYSVVNSLDWQYPIVFFKKDAPANLDSFYKFLLSNNLDECYVTSYVKGDKTITITNTKTDTEYTFSCEDF